MLFGTFLFSCKGILIKFLYPYGADALTVIGWRMGFVLPLFGMVLLFRHKKLLKLTLPLKHWLGVAILGCTGYSLAAYLDFSGLQYISVGLERIVVFLYPTFVVIINMIRERKLCSLRTTFALSLAYIGVITVYSCDIESFGPHQLKGTLLVLYSALIYGIYVVYAEQWLKKMNSIDFTATAMVAASLLTISYAWFVKGDTLYSYPPKFYGIAACLSFFCTFLPSFMISYGIQKVGSNQASIFACLGPAFTVIVAYFSLDEGFNGFEALGIGMTVMASLIISKKKLST